MKNHKRYELLRDIIKNDYYDDVFYFLNGESITDYDLDLIKDGNYDVYSEQECDEDDTNERYKVFHIEPKVKKLNGVNMIEIWIRKSKYKQIIRDIKINKILE